ncbi:MAG: amidophosphoribosyltransferase [Candidatus Helarchaeota archaeon]
MRCNEICQYRKLHDACGVVGIVSKDKNKHVARDVYHALMALQHRGQESAGIYTFAGRLLKGVKGMGLVYDVFNHNNHKLQGLFGNCAIGHVRYSTAGQSTIDNAQPFIFESPHMKFALALNGTLTNFIQLKKEYREMGHVFNTTTDTEVIAHVLASKIFETNDYLEGIKEAMEVLDGSYSMTILNEKGELYGVRDPVGFKPLCVGKTADGKYIIASESVAIDVLRGKLVKNFEPGEIVQIDESGKLSFDMGPKGHRHGFCVFEFVYFARPDTRFDSICVYDVREQLGRNLWETHGIDADVVVPIPDSGRTAASGFSIASGIPLREGLMKNRYIHRTFIMPSQQLRDYSVYLKLNPVVTQIDNKDVVLVDDSIVRGTTCRQIVKLLKDAGANKVHLRISCPPLIAPCYMGIDFPNKADLIAGRLNVEGIRKFIGADTLGYQTLEGLIKATRMPKSELCLACLTGDYPLKNTPDFNLLTQELNITK